jgi:hypothetical protein
MTKSSTLSRRHVADRQTPPVPAIGTRVAGLLGRRVLGMERKRDLGMERKREYGREGGAPRSATVLRTGPKQTQTGLMSDARSAKG